MTRFLLYSHDTYGLGHFRRSSLLAAGLTGSDPANEALIVTGSPRANAFSQPERVETIKLPAATKDDRGSYRPRKLGGGIESLVRLRSNLLLATVETYEPDVILVDHAPQGMCGELLPMFDHLDSRTRLALGLRDIIDEAGRTDAAWHRDDTWEQLDRYDDIFVYGDPRVLTTAEELGLDRRVNSPVTFTGYVAPTMPGRREEEPYILVTPGGGGDGHALLRRYLDAVERGATAGLRSTIVTGPLLSSARRAELIVRAGALPSVELIEFSDRLRSLVASATGVVSMAGYNTVVEELVAGTPALLIPRTSPRLEQHLRATRLAGVTGLEHCPVEALTPGRVATFVDRALHDGPMRGPIDLTGVRRVTQLLGAGSHRPTRRPAYV